MRTLAVILMGVALTVPVQAEIYTYTNEEGDYIVSQKKPKNRDISYAVLSDEGEFIRMVEGRSAQVPITHWRPFFLPREPHWLDGPDEQPFPRQDAEPEIRIDEVGDVESNPD